MHTWIHQTEYFYIFTRPIPQMGRVYKFKSCVFVSVCLSVRHHSNFSTVGPFKSLWRMFWPYKPYIFWKLMTPTIHWPTAHFPITHTDPPYPQNPPTTRMIWPFSTFWCFTLYKAYIFWKLVTPTIHWPTAHSPITHTDPPGSRIGIKDRDKGSG